MPSLRKSKKNKSIRKKHYSKKRGGAANRARIKESLIRNQKNFM